MTQHLKEYLAYYQTCKAPGFAVLVVGAWGAGKTFQVKQAIPESSRYYISLFGLQNVHEIHAEVATVMDPTLSKIKKLILMGGTLGNQAPGAWKLTGAGASIINNLIKPRTDNNKTFIFDDLERCTLNTKDLLGALNHYIEHIKCKVVVIAHDTKLTAEFSQSKEKLFGQTIAIEPQINDAFTAFCNEQPSVARGSFIRKHQYIILSIFEESGIKSLRILKHVIDDLGRLFDALTPDHLRNEPGITALVSLFVALDIEARDGLDEKDLRNRMNSNVAFRMREARDPDPKPRLVAAGEKYATLDLNSELLRDDVLVNMFLKGLYRTEEIRASLDASPYFAPPATLPAWRRLIDFDKLDDDIIQKARREMEEDFASRKYFLPGEILHVFALKLMMSENKIIDKTLDEVSKECEKYIEDILVDGTLPPRENTWDWARNHTDHDGGLLYWVTEGTREHFNTLARRLMNARERALEPHIPEMIEDLLNILTKNGETFYRTINSTPLGIGKYAYIPLLHKIEPSHFLDTWMKTSRSEWHHISTGLSKRQNSIGQGIGLEAEIQWFKDLKQLMEDEGNKLGGFEGLRLRRAAPQRW